MTRSQQKHLSRREAFTKNVRHKAQHEGIAFPAALTNKLKELNEKPATHRTIGYSVPAAQYATTRRNPGRMDGVTWRGSEFVPMDDEVDSSTEDDEESYEDNDHPSAPSSTPSSTPPDSTTINLLDIAKFAKPKGPAKDFHIVPAMRNVIVLEDEIHISHARWEDDDLDWEEIYEAEHRFIGQPSYSEVLTQRSDT